MRHDGVWYVLAALVAPFGLIYAPDALIVRGNALASELLLRSGIAARLLSIALFVFVLATLYRVLCDVSRRQAMLMAMLALVSVAISLFNAVTDMAVLAVFDKRQLDALAMLLLGIHRNGTVVAGIVWALWLLPFCALVIRSLPPAHRSAARGAGAAR